MKSVKWILFAGVTTFFFMNVASVQLTGRTLIDIIFDGYFFKLIGM